MATTAQALTVDPDQQAILKELAARELRSPEMLLRDALDAYIARALDPNTEADDIIWESSDEPYQTDEEAVAQAEEAWQQYQRTGLHVTWEEVDQWLAKLQAGEKVPPPECHT